MLSAVALEVVEQFARAFMARLRFEPVEELGFVFCERRRLVAEILLDHGMSVRALSVFFFEH